MPRTVLLLCLMVVVALTGCSRSDDDMASCLVGTWDANPSEMEPALAHALSLDGDAGLTVSGSQVLTFRADGTQSLDVDVTIDLASNGPGDDVFERGTAVGTWKLDGDLLTVTYTTTAITVRSAERSASTTMQDGTYLVTCSATTFTMTDDPSTVPADTPDSLRVTYTSQRR